MVGRCMLKDQTKMIKETTNIYLKFIKIVGSLDRRYREETNKMPKCAETGRKQEIKSYICLRKTKWGVLMIGHLRCLKLQNRKLCVHLETNKVQKQ